MRQLYETACAMMLIAASSMAASVPSTLPARGPHVVMLDVTGRRLAGQIVKADFARAIQLNCEGKPAIAMATDVIWLGMDLQAPPDEARPQPWFTEEPLPGKTPPKSAPRVQATLRDGQVLVGTLGEDTADALAVEHPLLGRWVLPFTELRQVCIGTGASQDARSTGPEPESPGMLDQLDLINGDHVEGIVREVGTERVILETAEGQHNELSIESVRAMQFAEVPAPAASSAPASQPHSRPPGQAWLYLRTGERLLGSSIVYSPEKVVFAVLYRGRQISVVPAVLVGIAPVSVRWQWLTVLAPQSYVHRPVLAPQLPWRADATCLGSPIYCLGQPVLHGIGVPAGSTLRYGLTTHWRTLVVWPAMDDSAGSVVTCRASIEVDGRQLWKGSVQALTTQPAAVVPLTGKHQMILAVEPGPTSDVLGRFIWAWAALVK